MTDTRKPLPWERQVDETDAAWDAFRRFRDMPLQERSMSRLASDMAETEYYTGKHETIRREMHRWSSIHNWRDRVVEWDREIDRRASDEHVDEIVKMRRRHAQQMEAILAAGIAPAAELLKRIKDQSLVLAEWSNSDLFKLTIAFARVAPGIIESERKSRGEPSEPAEQATPMVVSDLQVSDESLVELWAVLEDMGVMPKPPGLAETVEQAEQERSET